MSIFNPSETSLTNPFFSPLSGKKNGLLKLVSEEFERNSIFKLKSQRVKKLASETSLRVKKLASKTSLIGVENGVASFRGG